MKQVTNAKGSLELRREKGKANMPGWGKWKVRGKAQGCFWEGECAGSTVLRAFKGGDFREGLRGGSKKNIHQLFRCVLSRLWSLLIGGCQGSGH